jgi:hypothetical protein
MHPKMAIFFMACGLSASALLVGLRIVAAAPSNPDTSITEAPFKAQIYTLHVPLQLTLEEYLNAVAKASFDMDAPSF